MKNLLLLLSLVILAACAKNDNLNGSTPFNPLIDTSPHDYAVGFYEDTYNVYYGVFTHQICNFGYPDKRDDTATVAIVYQLVDGAVLPSSAAIGCGQAHNFTATLTNNGSTGTIHLFLRIDGVVDHTYDYTLSVGETHTIQRGF